MPRVGEDYIYPLPAYQGLLPPLPPVRAVDTATYMGPTEESNWVIHPRLLVGAYPSSVHDATNTAILSSILRLGVTTFVCLQLEYQHEGVTEAQWREGKALRPYIFDAIALVDSLPASFFPGDKGKPSGLEFVHFPIQDCAVANDASVLQLAKDLCHRLVKGEVMYLHCWGGHGRTGTVVSLMLGMLYGIAPLDAMRWVQFAHDLRVAPMGTPSPQTETQRQQVIRILNSLSPPPPAQNPAMSGGTNHVNSLAVTVGGRGKPVRGAAAPASHAGAAAGTLRSPSAAAVPPSSARQIIGSPTAASGTGLRGTTVRGGQQQLMSPQPALRGGSGVGGASASAAVQRALMSSSSGGLRAVAGAAAGLQGGRGGGTDVEGRRGGGAGASAAAEAPTAGGVRVQAYGDAGALPGSSARQGAAIAAVKPHLSPRPGSVVSVEGGGSRGGGDAPRVLTAAILADPKATAVAPFASSSGTVLGVAPPSLAQRRTAAAASYGAAASASFRVPPPPSSSAAMSLPAMSPDSHTPNSIGSAFSAATAPSRAGGGPVIQITTMPGSPRAVGRRPAAALSNSLR